MALTDLKVRKAKAEAKPYKIYDSLGLFVLVKPNGSKLWRQKYKAQGKVDFEFPRFDGRLRARGL